MVDYLGTVGVDDDLSQRHRTAKAQVLLRTRQFARIRGHVPRVPPAVDKCRRVIVRPTTTTETRRASIAAVARLALASFGRDS